MQYLRVDHKGNMQAVPDEVLTLMISHEQGHVLVVTGQTSRSKAVYDALTTSEVFSSCKPREMELKTPSSNVRICSSLEWIHYAGLQLSSAYIHRDATVDFAFKIMSKLRFPPSFYLTNSPN